MIYTNVKVSFHLQVTCLSMIRAKFAVRNVRSLVSLISGAQRSGTIMVNSLSQPSSALRCYSASVAAESFLNGSSSVYVEGMYNSWLEDPKSVHKVHIVTIVTFIC